MTAGFRPEPVPSLGIVSRPPSGDEAAQLAELYDSWANGSGLTWRIPAEEIVHEMASPDADLAADYRVAADANGRLVASVVAHLRSVPGRKHRAWLFVITSRPRFETLETAAAAWGVERARDVFGCDADEMQRVVRVNADIRDATRVARLEELGFTTCRYFAEMIRPLSDPIPEPGPSRTALRSPGGTTGGSGPRGRPTAKHSATTGAHCRRHSRRGLTAVTIRVSGEISPSSPCTTRPSSATR